ncbi:MAG TPA: carbohydrate-binding protein [Kribbella sp.]
MTRRGIRHTSVLIMTVLITALGLSAPMAEAGSVIPPGDYQQVSLASGSNELGEAMSLAVLPDRTVIHTARDGSVRVTDAAGNTKLAGKLTVYTHDEEGLQGVAVDPNFATNRFVYLYFSPRLTTPDGDAPTDGTQADWDRWKGELHLSRFVLKTDNTLDLASEKVVLRVPNDRGQCCHVGGDLDFDAAGNLYLTTGDDSNPFQSDGYTPIDERTTRNPQFDAQRTAGNTNDLRGKLLRIHPQPDGTYTIPSGNMFAPGTAQTRPEIYAMGFRNPFRMSVDRTTGIVYLGDYGPDAGVTNANRGPNGQVEFNRITSPGNYGWPYCTGTNTTNETYNDFQFPSGPSGGKFNCAGGVTNNSFRNTGQTQLQPAKPSWIRYGGDAGTPPEFGTGGSESPMGGPVYRYDPNLNSAVKFPASLDGRYFAGEYGRKWIKAIEVTAGGTPGDIGAFPWTGTQVMDMAFGPDGALYVLDYGTGSNNQALWRVEYRGNQNRNPIAKASANPTSGGRPLTVAFSSAGSSDPEGGALTYRWTFGDGGTSTQANPTYTFNTAGTYTATLTVTDPAGLTGSANVQISVGNTAPTITLQTPLDGQLFSFGDTVPFQVSVSDPEDGTIDCSRVKVTYLLGHDDHRHQITSKNGCTGSIAVPVDGEHDAAANVFGVFDAEYTDNGGLTSHSVRTLQPRHRQAEHFSAQSGIQLADHGTAEGGRTVGFVDSGDWISFQPYAVGNATSFTARVSSGTTGGTIEVRAGSATGTLMASLPVTSTGGWDTFANVSANLTNRPAGSMTLFLVFRGGAGNLFDVDSFTIATAGSIGSTIQGEAFTSQFGVQAAAHAGASGGQTLGFIDNGDWAGYSSVSTTGARTFSARVSSGGAGGTIQVRSGSATGTLLGSVTVPVTGGWETFQTVSTTLTGSAAGPLFLTFTGGAGNLFDVDTFTIS